MTEEKLQALRQADHNLRDALRMDEAELPQMPANLNERLMQRMATQEEKKPRRTVWPWIAAACVAGVMMIWLTPPKDPVSSPAPLRAEREVATPKTEKAVVEVAEAEQPQIAEVKKVKKAAVKHRKQQPKTVEPETLPAEVVTSVVEEPKQQLAQTTTKVKMQTLTEHDIPITRPENYKYTPEELAQLRKQANEAYLKWVELELEISKNNLQQTAQK
jgi:hypothetical protein